MHCDESLPLGQGSSRCVDYQHELLACCALVAGCGRKHQHMCCIFCAEAHGDVTDFACVHCLIQPGSHTAYAAMSLLCGIKCGTPL